MDYGRCPKKWYWRWLRGLTPIRQQFGALDLGTWVHSAFDMWYDFGYKRADTPLPRCLEVIAGAEMDVAKDQGATDALLEKAEDQAALGHAMLRAYQGWYGQDPDVCVVALETPLQFKLGDTAIFKLKPDMVFRDRERLFWLMEHKTAASIRTEHLVIDGQARPYAAMAERALKNAGILRRDEELSGIVYNFLRKALPDERPRNADGKYLNKNGSVSQKQPPPYFLRKPIKVSRRAKAVTLRRVMNDAEEMASLRDRIRNGSLAPFDIRKTPHYSCHKTCDYFTACVTEEEGGDIRSLLRSTFRAGDPYAYYQDSTNEPSSFEMG